MATPSKVEVPLPSSSSTTKEFLVEFYNICTVSSISIKKVLLPSISISEAPILAYILSTNPITHSLAGT